VDIVNDADDSKIGPLSLTQGHKPDHITGIAALRDGVPRSTPMSKGAAVIAEDKSETE
jgi:hypothetical protein